MTVQDQAKASPTKEFFVQMLVKDVNLISAVMDLIDNCVDGAMRIRGDGRFDDLFVRIKLTRDEFEIKDNCGGMDVELAKNYAFMFGRSAGTPSLESSIGLFGVGMKRAIFKMGKKFNVASTWSRSWFEVSENVEDWQKRDEDKWAFPIKYEKYKKDVPEGNRGTTIKVWDLYDGVKNQFADPLFISSLEREVSDKEQTFLDRGLNIKINGISVVASTPKFAYALDGSLLPAREDQSYDGVAVRLFSGVGEREVEKAGWYVYCNGRMVVKADQTSLTGWGEMGTTKIPRYHHQFSRFVGCAFFDSEDSSRLPWNTTKDGLDVELDIYRTVKLRMVSMMRPVIDFLNLVDKELDEPDKDKRVLSKLLEKAEYLPPTTALPIAQSFKYTRPRPIPKRPETVRIQYDRPKDLADRVKKHLRASSYKNVGEKTFDWYVENEFQDE
jgi:hypothetical protein